MRLSSISFVAVVVALTLCYASPARAASDTIKVGILHSLSGTLGGSETPLKDVMLMLINQTNAQGGILGKQIEPVVVDGKSNWPLYAQLARQLISQDKVAVIFGCWTSVSRKSVLTVFEELNHLLFYPVQYEGEECSKNIFYTGAAVNQQAIPAVDYLYAAPQNRRRFVLCGTDYVYPRTTNTILYKYLISLGIPDSDILTIYTPFGHSDWSALVDKIETFAAEGERDGKAACVVSTLNGDVNTFFYQEIARRGIDANRIPIVAFSLGEAELQAIDTTNLVGHLAAWNYFMSVSNPINAAFIRSFHTFMNNDQLVTNDPMEAHYIGWKMWVAAVSQAGTTDIDAVRQAVYGQVVESPSGYNVSMGTNHHLSKPVMIGRMRQGGQFDVLFQTNETVPAVPWSPFTNPSGVKCQWSWPWVCGRCDTPTYASYL